MTRPRDFQLIVTGAPTPEQLLRARLRLLGLSPRQAEQNAENEEQRLTSRSEPAGEQP